MLAKDAVSNHNPSAVNNASVNAPAEVIGGMDVAAQALELLHQLSDEQYNHVASPYLQSTIGQHMRHILDVFHAITAWPQSDFVDYDLRRRAHPVEKNKTIAIDEWISLYSWLETIREADLSTVMNISGEVSLKHHVASVTQSTLGRELSFVASHAVHHFALIRVSLCAQGISTAETFGMAPATATFYRGGD
ncbi:DinB family protein [Enterovibrio sp. 27052020O]|uniref:DinB family protein n=1 Tax=Enterovibrio sp. 27052020O TaxID=3241166 RepID=UPI00388E16D6